MVTDNTLLVSSINLNKMNLGHFKTKKFWRENTESALISHDSNLIMIAKRKFEENFERGLPVEDLLCNKLEETVKDIFQGASNLSPNPEVRTLFAKFILKREIHTKRMIIKVGKITKKLMTRSGRNRVEKEDFVSALFYFICPKRKKISANLQKSLLRSTKK
jgi:hypothetical protein